MAHPNCHTSVPAESSANRTEKGLINNEWSGARYFASNPQDRNPRLVCFDLQSSSNSSTVSANRRTTLTKTTPSCSSRTCPSGICRSQRGEARKTSATTSSRMSGLNRETGTNSLPSGKGGSQEVAETPAVLSNESPSLPPAVDRSPVDRSRRYPRILLLLFLCTLPLVNPIVHGDGVGYYAYVRAPLIQHNLRFEISLPPRRPSLCLKVVEGRRQARVTHLHFEQEPRLVVF